jgi:hypothetical protein
VTASLESGGWAEKGKERRGNGRSKARTYEDGKEDL